MNLKSEDSESITNSFAFIILKATWGKSISKECGHISISTLVIHSHAAQFLGTEHIKITIEDAFYNTWNSLIVLYLLHMLLQI